VALFSGNIRYMKIVKILAGVPFGGDLK